MAAAQWDRFFPKLYNLCDLYQDGKQLQECMQTTTDKVIQDIRDWLKEVEDGFWHISADQRGKLQQLREKNLLRLKVPPRIQVIQPTPAQRQPDREQLVSTATRGGVNGSSNGTMIHSSSSFSNHPNEQPRVVATLSYSQLMGMDGNGSASKRKKSKPITKKKKMKNDDPDDEWWSMYALLLQYYDEYGDFEIEDNYIVEQDDIEYELGLWLSTQQEWLETYIEYCPERYKKLEELMFTKGLFGVIEPDEIVNNDDKLYFEVLGHEVPMACKPTFPTTRGTAYLENPVIATNTPRHRIHRTNNPSSAGIMHNSSSSNMRGNAVLGQGPASSSWSFTGISVNPVAKSRKNIQTKPFMQLSSHPAAGQKRKPATNNRADHKKKRKGSKKRRGYDSNEEDEYGSDDDEAMDGDESGAEESEDEIVLNEAFWKHSSSSSMLRADNKDTNSFRKNSFLPSSSSNGYGKGNKSSSKSQPQAARKFEAPDSPASLVSEEATTKRTPPQVFKAVLHQIDTSTNYLKVGLVVQAIKEAQPQVSIFRIKLLNRLRSHQNYFEDVFELADSVTTWKSDQVFGDTYFYQIDEGFYSLTEEGALAIKAMLNEYKMVRLP